MLSQHMLICLGGCFHCTQFLKFETHCSQMLSLGFPEGKSCLSYYTINSLKADTLSNTSVSQKMPHIFLREKYVLK